MNIAEKTESGVKILMLSGRIDGQTAGELEAATSGLFDREDKLVLDLSGVAFVSSAGLRVILIGAKKMTARKAAYGLCGVRPEVMDVFKMSGFNKILTFYDDLGTALGVLGG